MNKFDLHSAKFICIILGICFIFVMVIWHAYSYLPEKDLANIGNGQEIKLPQDNEPNEEEMTEVEEESNDENVNNNDDVKFDSNSKNNEQAISEKSNVVKPEPLESISEDGSALENNANTAETVSSIEKMLENAKNYQHEHKYSAAVSEYQKAISLTSDSEEKALCYENIAKIYATTKHYGTALSFAQKSFNTSPSTAREVLLARLYYKTGDVDKATNRINNVLTRDFSVD